MAHALELREVTSEQEAQSVQFLALVPMIAPMLFLQSILNAPIRPALHRAGPHPFHVADHHADADGVDSDPGARDCRLADTLLAAGIGAVAWIAGKVHRVGILSTGKRPTLGELARWVRSA